jgi:hypothetical protein
MQYQRGDEVRDDDHPEGTPLQESGLRRDLEQAEEISLRLSLIDALTERAYVRSMLYFDCR